MSTDESLTEAIEEEWELEVINLITEVATLIFSGIVGGMAFQLVLTDMSGLNLAVWTFALLGFGVAFIGAVKAIRDIMNGFVRWQN